MSHCLAGVLQTAQEAFFLVSSKFTVPTKRTESLPGSASRRGRLPGAKLEPLNGAGRVYTGPKPGAKMEILDNISTGAIPGWDYFRLAASFALGVASAFRSPRAY
jgi:hypothetical protein